MSRESDFIDSLRHLARHPAARALRDDAAVLKLGGSTLVFTHDMLIETVHFLADDPPEDVAWKLVAVNMSDLAAKGAKPLAILLGFSLKQDSGWEVRFVQGLERATTAFGLILLGGDTVAMPYGTPRSLGLTAIGVAQGIVPSRAGARATHHIWVSGTIGDARAGLRIAKRERSGPDQLVERYRLPRPRLEAGRKLAPLVSAMMDVSDGLLLDAQRLAEVSGVSAVIELESLPLSAAYLDFAGDDRGSRLSAASAGDDYELLFTAQRKRAAAILALGDKLGLPFTRVGRIEAGSGLRIVERGAEVPLPPRLGFEH